MSIVCIRNNNCVFICRNHVQNIHPCHHYLHLSSFSLLIQLPSSLTSCAHQVLVKTLVSKNFVQAPAINQSQIQINSMSMCWSFKQGTFRVTEWKTMPGRSDIQAHNGRDGAPKDGNHKDVALRTVRNQWTCLSSKLTHPTQMTRYNKHKKHKWQL